MTETTVSQNLRQTQRLEALSYTTLWQIALLN